MIDTAVIINALYNRVKAGQLTIEQVPEAFRNDVQALVDKDNENNEES